MPIILNGTTLGSSNINGTSLGTIKFNGTTVFTSAPPYYNELKSGTQLTEAQWLAFLDGDGIKYIINKGEQSTFRGKKITISNSQTTSYSTWIIADFNHDNTSNTCDVVQANTVAKVTFSSSTQYYEDSSIRKWLILTYYNGFSTNVKNKLQTMSVASNHKTLNDKVKILSGTEVGISAGDMLTEGAQYPIFTDNNSRKRTGADNSWWLRSRYTRDTSTAYYIFFNTASGQIFAGPGNCVYNYGAVPVLRFA